MIEMSGMAKALQAHNDQLQKYLSAWSKKQQQLLETMCTSPTSPLLETCALQQDSADKMPIEGASNVVIPASTSSPYDFLDENLEISESVEFTTAALTEAQLIMDSETGDTAGCAADGRDGHSTQDVINSNELERYRSELVQRFERWLSTLKSMTCLKKGNIKTWLIEILTELQEQVPALKELNDESDADSQTMRSAKHSVLSTPSTEEAKGRYEKFHDVVELIVHSNHFDMVSAVVIVLNAIVMGIAADHQMNNLDGAENRTLNYFETAFFIFYSIELVLRLCHEGRRFFISRDWKWNWFDFVLVILSSYDQLGPLLMDGGNSAPVNVSFLRLFRLLKMAKLLRMIRLMKMFKHLRLILASIFGSSHAIFWAGILVLIISYMASVLFVNLCSNFLMDATAKNLDISVDVQRGIEQYWSSVTTGMRSVFGATTGGDSWFNIVAPLSSVGWGCSLLFSFYMGFFLVVVLNTFSSLFVQSVLENSAKDDTTIIEEEMRKKDVYIRQLESFFDEIDGDGNGRVTLDEFSQHLDDPKLQAWASCLEIEVADAAYFFGVLSGNGKIPIDIENFVTGCIQLKGTAKSVDLMGVFQLVKEVHKKTQDAYTLTKEIRALVTDKEQRRADFRRQKSKTIELTSLRPIKAAL